MSSIGTNHGKYDAENACLLDAHGVIQAEPYSDDSLYKNCPALSLDAHVLDEVAVQRRSEKLLTPVQLPVYPIGPHGKSRSGAFRLRTLPRKDVLVFEESMLPAASTSSTASSYTAVNLNSGCSRASSSASGRSVSPLPTIWLTGSRQMPTPAPFSPCWSMRYCEFMGSITEGLNEGMSSADPDAKLIESSKPKNNMHGKASTHGKASNNRDAASESAFLAKNARDKRLSRLDDADYKPKPSRLEARRGAITNFGQSRMQVQCAVKMMFARYPGHMRKLAKFCTMKGGQLQIGAKSLSSKELDELSEKVGMLDDEIQTFYSAFIRYDVDDDGFLDRAELRQGIADLGLQPRNRAEKIELQEILNDHEVEGLGGFNFNDYLSLVKTIRDRLREIQSTEFMVAFRWLDTDCSRTADLQEAMAFLQDKMGLSPRSGDETMEVQSIFHSLDADGDGHLSIEECQDFVQRVRAKLSIMRREEEMTIAKAFHLTPEVVMEFRMDLPLFWEIFNRYDSAGQHRIGKMDLMGLLMDVGVAPAQLDNSRMQTVENVVEDFGKDENDFVHVLCIIHEARKQCTEPIMDELAAKFNFYDRNRNGSLAKPEIFQILEDFRMLPRCREEQHEIAMCIERLDADGSGCFDFDEFLDFFQRLTEQVEQGCRRREAKACKQMGFSDEQIAGLRRHYLSLCHDAEGKVAQLEMAHTLPQLYSHGDFAPFDDVRLKELTKRAQKAPDHAVAFSEFVSDVHSLMCDWGDDGAIPTELASPKQAPSVNGAGGNGSNGETGTSSIEFREIRGTAESSCSGPSKSRMKTQRTKEITSNRASSLGSDAIIHN